MQNWVRICKIQEITEIFNSTSGEQIYRYTHIPEKWPHVNVLMSCDKGSALNNTTTIFYVCLFRYISNVHMDTSDN